MVKSRSFIATPPRATITEGLARKSLHYAWVCPKNILVN